MTDNPKILNFYHLLNYTFNIPEYQRGYRWEQKQVVDLMNDIKDFIDRRDAHQVKDKEFYCLQPVVVYKIGDNHYDVIDGQQRLTTLYLILQALKSTIEENCDNQNIYRIGYSKFVDDPKESDYLNNNYFLNDDDKQYLTADNFFIRQAYVEICNWFLNNKRHRVPFAQMLMNNDGNSTLPDEDKKDLRVIWYETDSGSKDNYDSVQSETTSIEIFNRLNYGQIKLTDTELIKALIMQSDCYTEKKHAGMEQWTSKVAADWDNIEKRLHEPFFWSMLNAVEDAGNPSHIGFLLSFAAKDIYKENSEDESFKNIKKDNHFDYVVIDRWLSQKGGNREMLVKDLWNRIMDIFSLFESWYEDLEVYHRIGLLVLFLERTKDRDSRVNNLISELYDQKLLKKSAFINILNDKIASTVKICSKNKDKDNETNTLKSIKYGENSEEIIRVLELVNVIDHLRKPNDSSRFPFHLFKKYNVTSLEHIHPQNIVDIPFKEACSWLERKMSELSGNGLEGLDDKGLVPMAKEAAEALRHSLVYRDENAEDKEVREANKKANQEAEKLYESSKEIKELIGKVDNVFDELAGMNSDEMHSIRNMALVDKNTNSALQNYLLDTKRNILNERSKVAPSDERHTYVPITTELVFNKAFSKSVKELKFWSLPDRDAYYAHIESIYNEFVK